MKSMAAVWTYLCSEDATNFNWAKKHKTLYLRKFKKLVSQKLYIPGLSSLCNSTNTDRQCPIFSTHKHKKYIKVISENG